MPEREKVWLQQRGDEGDVRMEYITAEEELDHGASQDAAVSWPDTKHWLLLHTPNTK